MYLYMEFCFNLQESKYNPDIHSSDYKYSVSDLALSREQRDFYEINGYLVVPKLVPDYLLDRCWYIIISCTIIISFKICI